MTLSKHATQIAAIKAAKTQAIEESLHSEDGIGEAVVLLASGGTRIFRSRNGCTPSATTTSGWLKDGHVNVPASIYDMVY